MREPFPLQWPASWPRTKAVQRVRSKFGFKQSGQVSFSAAWNFLRDELDRLGAANAIVTSDLPVRNDGVPYAASGRMDDPGVAVWFVLDGQERVFACDKWLSHAENMQSIAMSIEAIRGLDRWGAADVVQRAFSGFAALPPGSGGAGATPMPPTKRPWRVVLEMTSSAFLTIPNVDQLVIVKQRYRELIKKSHPDAGGSHELAAEINIALAEAERELGATP